MDEILQEGDAFAKSLSPAAAQEMPNLAHGHARCILEAIALDIATGQSPQQRHQKSLGHARGDARSAAALHGALRHAKDFTLLQLNGEFRALRATVLRLWLPRVTHADPGAMEELMRFNEAIDQALAESLATFCASAERTRELFLAILGHDLRAPLATMSMAGELLTHPQLPPGQVIPTGMRVSRSAWLMTRMVDDLLCYTRTQLGSAMPVALHPCNLQRICEDAIEDARATHEGIDFQLLAQGDLEGAFDDVRLHQLCTNLLVNAAQYGDKTHPVRITATGGSEALTIEVRNFGNAIAPEALEAIFKPLVQLPGEGNQDARPCTSMGLGLFVAREIALAHGGSIDVRSSPREGTSFRVWLPRKTVPGARSDAAPP